MFTVYFLGKHAGDLYIQANCKSLSQTYNIEDCVIYISEEITTAQTFDIALPAKYSLEYEIIKIQNSSGSASARIHLGSNNNNLHSGFNSTGNTDLMIWDGSNVQVINGLSLNSWGKVTLKIDDTNRTVEMTALGNTVTLSNISYSLSNFYSIGDNNWNGNYSKFRNIKIKPL